MRQITAQANSPLGSAESEFTNDVLSLRHYSRFDRIPKLCGGRTNREEHKILHEKKTSKFASCTAGSFDVKLCSVLN